MLKFTGALALAALLLICFNCRKTELIEEPVPPPVTCNLDCRNGGECIDFACHCPEKWRGVNCEKYFTSTFEGDYISTDFDCGLGTGGQVMSVNVDPSDSNRILIGNLIADMVDVRNFTLVPQSGASSGSGFISRDSMYITYNTSLVVFTITCQGNFLRKK
jgi:hypothetical protein